MFFDVSSFSGRNSDDIRLQISVTTFARTFLAKEKRQVMISKSFIDANMTNDEYQGR
jgi:hypothetical protein